MSANIENFDYRQFIGSNDFMRKLAEFLDPRTRAAIATTCIGCRQALRKDLSGLSAVLDVLPPGFFQLHQTQHLYSPFYGYPFPRGSFLSDPNLRILKRSGGRLFHSFFIQESITRVMSEIFDRQVLPYAVDWVCYPQQTAVFFVYQTQTEDELPSDKRYQGLLFLKRGETRKVYHYNLSKGSSRKISTFLRDIVELRNPATLIDYYHRLMRGQNCGKLRIRFEDDGSYQLSEGDRTIFRVDGTVHSVVSLRSVDDYRHFVNRATSFCSRFITPMALTALLGVAVAYYCS